MRKDITVAVAVSIVFGMAGGVLLGRDLPDVLVVGLALAVLAVWTVTAGAVGALVERHRAERRRDDDFELQLQLALEMREGAERYRLVKALADQRARIEAKYAADTEAVNDAVKEGR